MRWLLLLPGLAACITPTYTQHRAAFVPHASAIPYDGQPMETQGMVSIGADNLVDLVRPRVGDPTQGDEVPEHQLRGQAALRVSDDFSIAGVYEQALAQNATAVSPTSPRISDATLNGVGFSLRWSTWTEVPGFHVAIALEIMTWHVPWVEYNQCVQNCDSNTSYAATDSKMIPTFGVALGPSYRVGRMTYFGGMTIRNQPTITELNTTTTPDDDGGPNGGSVTVTLHAGVGVDVGAGVHANAILQDTVSTDPIAYGPSIGLEVEIPLGKRVPPQSVL